MIKFRKDVINFTLPIFMEQLLVTVMGILYVIEFKSSKCKNHTVIQRNDKCKELKNG